MIATPLELLLSRLPDAKRNGKGWTARCPAHDDRNPSLSIAEGDDGRVLLHCHAGCAAVAICESLGLKTRDLMVVDVDRTLATPRTTSVVSTPAKVGRTYSSAKDAVAVLERQHGKRSAMWTYHDADGDPVGLMVRWDKSAGKEIRPVARHGDTWIIGGMPTPKPLYWLPNMADADRVFVLEGEKAVDAARSINLVATTSPHGSKSAAKANWSVLAGKEVIVLPDNDPAGRSYADDVSAILAKLTPASKVKIVDLPGLPEHGDIVDWIEAHGEAAEPDGLRREVEALANEARVIDPSRRAPHVDQFQPFPVDVLPEPIREFVVAGSKAIGCDTSLIALPVLAAASAAIGNSRRIQLKQGWTEPAILWLVTVVTSGGQKTPAFDLALRPVRDVQAAAIKTHDQDAADHQRACQEYDRDLAVWKKSKDNVPQPAKPETPQPSRFIISDTTVEALAPMLRDNWRGLLLARDELDGWFCGFGEYKGGKGGDLAHWLSMHSVQQMIVDRKTGQQKTIFVPRALVCITGGIQPGTLRRSLGREHLENGLAARLLFSMPPCRPKRWTEAAIGPDVEARFACALDRLRELRPDECGDDDPEPVIVRMSPSAKAAWKKFYNEHAQEQAELSDELASAWSKLEASAARIALVLHFLRWAGDDSKLESEGVIDEASVLAGIRLARWFGHEARRVYRMLTESEDERGHRRLAEWIGSKGGSVTPRDLMRSSRRYAESADVAEAALDDLAKAGYGRWESTASTGKGGRPTRRLVLTTADVDTTPSNPEENGSCVNVDTINGPDDERGWL
jgi:hypothetical protein